MYWMTLTTGFYEEISKNVFLNAQICFSSPIALLLHTIYSFDLQKLASRWELDIQGKSWKIANERCKRICHHLQQISFVHFLSSSFDCVI